MYKEDSFTKASMANSPNTLTNKTVIVVDNDMSVGAHLKLAASDIGHIYLAATSSEAIELCKQYKPDIMLIDVDLPDMTGFELIEYLKINALDNNASFIIITAKASDDSYIHAVKVGARAFLSKPVNSLAAIQIIEVILSDNNKINAVVGASQQQFDKVLNLLSDVVVISDEMGKIKSVNQYCLNLFGYKKEELIGENVKILTPPTIRVEHDKYLSEYTKSKEAKLIGKPRELSAFTKSGKEITINLNLSEFWENNVKSYVAIIRDVTEKKQLKERILKNTFFDSLTDLRTINALNYDFESINYAEQQQGYISAVILDIDELQELNSVYGYETGDTIIKEVANEIKHIAQNHNAEAYRVSGDRFIVASLSTDKVRALNDETQCLWDFEHAITTIKNKLDMPISLTTICMVKPVADFQTNSIIQLLEMSIIAARQEGNRGKISQYSEARIAYALEKNSLSMKLKAGVNVEYLDIAIQPKVNCNARITSCEALLRWHDPEFTLLYLPDFISASEATAAIIEVGQYVLKRVCQFLSALEPEKRVKIFINLSIRQFADAKLIDKIQAYCKEYNIPHSLLGFELTESMIAEDMSLLKSKLIALEALGFEIAVDDFGTGQSNLKYIHKLPAATIKIDKSFIDDINGEAENYPIVDAVIAMTEKMHRKTVAEGVETQIQAEYLWRKGVDEIQGYFYYKPMPVSDALVLLAKQ